MIEHFARPYERELHGRKPCTAFMDATPVVADKDDSLQAVSVKLVQGGAQHMLNGFIVTDRGVYVGMGTGHDLMREITQMQMHAARYANPLTQLPGNVPINEHVERLIASGARFWACYCDLDHFKPFNDVYGYRKGDDVIQLAGGILSAHADPERDFVGHIGGDDFIVVFQSEDWEARCHGMLADFAAQVAGFHSPDDRERGGYLSEDRQGKKVFHALMSLSIGAVRVEPQQFANHHLVATAASEAKKQAKKIFGNALFVDRRGAGPA